ncbi:MAG: TetR/AcrR family transcriptional regulator [Butyricicoccaceae bacterium]
MEKKTDLRVQKTRKALYDTFLIMLSEKKFEDITVNALCERALVRRATFYKHFADKYDFFAFFVREMRSQLVTRAAVPLDGHVPDAYYLPLFQELVSFLSQHKTLVNSVLNSSAFPTLLDILSEEIRQGIVEELHYQQRAGTVLPMSPDLLAAFHSGGIIYILRFWMTHSKQLSEEQVIHDYKEILHTFHLRNT